MQSPSQLRVFTITLMYTVIICGSLSNPANGQLTLTATSAGGIATYNCSEGHSLVGSGERECQCNSQWSGAAPTCNGESVYRRKGGRVWEVSGVM